MILVFAFLSGFTYRDWGAADGIQGVLASIRQTPSRIASAISTTVQNRNTTLAPVETYWNVYSYINSSYYETVKKPKPASDDVATPVPFDKKLTYSAIRGMLASLGDRYTRFMDPEEFTRMQQENRGDFEGIGAELEMKDSRVIIKKPIPNSPAEKAGLKPQDIILKVDEKLIQGMDIQDVVKRIRGAGGTKVKLTIKRDEVAEPLIFEITRGVIPFTIVEQRMEDKDNKIGYIALRQFNEKSDDQMDIALGKLEDEGMRGLVLDLRGNPGGLLDVAVDIGSRFVDSGNIVKIRNKGGMETPLSVENRKHNHKRYPLAVLIDGSSASASEILAGAIQDHKAGTLVGTESFGKGLVQTIINLEDGSAVAITTAKYLTPNGHEVTPKAKIHPDIKVEPSDDDIKNENDIQLKKAVEFLKEHLGDKQAKTHS